MIQNPYYYRIKSDMKLADAIEQFIGHKLDKRRVTKSYLVLFMYAPVLSVEIICAYFAGLSYAAVQKQLHRLETDGYIEHHYISKGSRKKSRDSRTKQLYTMTPKGYRYIKPELYQDKKYIKFKSSKYLMHNYSCANAFLSFLTSGHELRYYEIEERVNTSKRQAISKYDIFSDAVCLIDNKAFYIEQDMGTEHSGIVREKLDRYAWFYDSIKYKSRDSIIVILFKKPNYTPIFEPRYDIKNLEIIAEEILYDDETIGELYEELDDAYFEPEINNTIKDFVENMPVDTCKHFGPEEMKNFTESLINHTNIYYTYDYNQYQEEYTNKKRWELLYEYYYNYMTYFSKKVMTEWMYYSSWFLMSKSDCYMFSSVLFKNLLSYIDNMNSNHEKVLKRYAHSLKYTFEGTLKFSKWSGDIRRFDNEDRDEPPELHNCYLIGSHIISFEYPDISIGSFMRCLHLQYKYKGDNITLILCVLNESNARMLAQEYYKIKRFSDTISFSGYNFYFFNINDFSEINPKLYILDKNGMKQYIESPYDENNQNFS